MATRKQTVGERFETEGKAPSTPLKSAVEIAAIERAVAAEKFPKDLKASFELLARINAEQVSTQEEWEERQPRLRALKLHIHTIQQGTVAVGTKSGDFNHAHMTSVIGQMKLDRMVKSSPEVAAVVKERDALKKANADLVANNKAVSDELAAIKKSQVELTTSSAGALKETAKRETRIVELEKERDALSEALSKLTATNAQPVKELVALKDPPAGK